MGAANLNARAQALLNALNQANRRQPDVVPPGWLTSEQIAKLQGKDQSTVQKALKALGNKVESKKYRVLHKSGALIAVAHYRLK
jgi:hypothetical protein